MKEDEKLFFVLCFQLRMQYGIDVRNIINMLQPFINKKRLWYLLEKWFRQGFYDFSVRLDLGWFEIEKFPNRYSDLLVNVEAIHRCGDCVFIETDCKGRVDESETFFEIGGCKKFKRKEKNL